MLMPVVEDKAGAGIIATGAWGWAVSLRLSGRGSPIVIMSDQGTGKGRKWAFTWKLSGADGLRSLALLRMTKGMDCAVSMGSFVPLRRQAIKGADHAGLMLFGEGSPCFDAAWHKSGQ